MRFDEVGLLVGFRFLLGFAEFFDQAHGFAFEAAVEAAAGARVDDVAELGRGEVEESGRGVRGLCVGGGFERDGLVKVDAAVGEFAEGSLLLELYGLGRSISRLLNHQRINNL